MTEKERKELVKKLKRFIRPLEKAGKVAGMYALLNFCAPSAQAQFSYLADKNPTYTTNPANYPKTRTVNIQVDTVESGQTAYAKTSPSRGIITINYVPGDEGFNILAQDEDHIIHEIGHIEDFMRGAYDYPISPQQALIRDRHEEIAANINVLIYKRAKYLETGNLDVFNGFFSYYRKAIEDGTIIPNSQNLDEFNKEMKFIFDETQKNWIKHRGKEYEDQDFDQAIGLGDFEGKYRYFWDQNYEQSLNIIYTKCGINFWQYHTKDLEISDVVQKKLNAIIKKTPQKTASTENNAIYKSSIPSEPRYYIWSEEKRVSTPIAFNIPYVVIQTPPGYQQKLPKIDKDRQQKFEEYIARSTQKIPQDSEESVPQNIQENKKEKKKNGWNEFWEKVGDFFRPSWKQKPDRSSAPAAKPTTTPKPAPVAKTAPKPAPAVPQNTVVDTLSQQNQLTENISEPKSKWNEFWDKVGDFFRPSWKQKPEKKTTVSQTSAPKVKVEPTPAPTPKAKPTSTSAPTPVAKSAPQPEQAPTPAPEQKAQPAPDSTTVAEQNVSPAPEQVETTNRISSGKDRAVRMHNKLKKKVLEEEKAKYQRDQKREQRKEQRKSRECNKIKQQIEKEKAKS
ncbi:MAG: hypothetical protein J6T72_03675 [Alphaproteobacteria bacterium]|nr:hypothetical protein [Alphaproteobacteria bacterium]